MTGKGSDPAPIEDDQGAIAVMLDLVYPALSEGGSGTSVGISGLIKPRGTGSERGICRLCSCSALGKVESQEGCGWLRLCSSDCIGLTEREGAAEQGTARDHTCDIWQIK